MKSKPKMKLEHTPLAYVQSLECARRALLLLDFHVGDIGPCGKRRQHLGSIDVPIIVRVGLIQYRFDVGFHYPQLDDDAMHSSRVFVFAALERLPQLAPVELAVCVKVKLLSNILSMVALRAR